MQLPHHKNEAKWGRAAISFNLPQDLAVVMDLYISKGHKLLTEYIGLDNVCHVFVDRKGRPFLDTNLTIYWDKMLVSMGLATPISPSLCRQVFVHERRSAGRVPGPSDRGAAMVMGHALAQWSKWYDIDFHTRESQQAVDAMATWRNSLLSSPDQPAQIQHATAPQQAPLSQAATSPESGHSSPSQHDASDMDAGWSSVDDDESVSFHDEDDDDFAIDIHDS